MNDQSFIDAVCASPKDDGPRLVYADFLEERGNPRAEFIRVQCELARVPPCNPKMHLQWRNDGIRYKKGTMPKCPTCVVRKPLEDRSDELLALHRREWTPHLVFDCAGPGDQYIGVDFRRGFPELLTCRFEEWAARHAELMAAMPVSRVILATRPEQDWTSRGMMRRDWTFSEQDTVPALLSAEWPGIEFVLLPVVQRDDDAPVFDVRGLPLPITHSEFWRSAARTLEASRT